MKVILYILAIAGIPFALSLFIRPIQRLIASCRRAVYRHLGRNQQADRASSYWGSGFFFVLWLVLSICLASVSVRAIWLYTSKTDKAIRMVKAVCPQGYNPLHMVEATDLLSPNVPHLLPFKQFPPPSISLMLLKEDYTRICLTMTNIE